jgi:hypothetical protein
LGVGKESREREDAMWRNKSVAMVGAAVGFALFLVIGLLPALLYGGYAGLLLATAIFGAPFQAGFFSTGLVVFVMLLGTFGTASVFAVAGAVLASGSVHVAEMLTPVPRVAGHGAARP